MRGLNDADDFLYATIDVAIWSTCETGIALSASAAATLRPLLRKIFGEISLPGSSSRKLSRANWGGNSRSRSGYLPHPSVGGDDRDIPLETQDSKHPKTQQIRLKNGHDLSRSTSTVGLRDWEHEKDFGDKSSADSTPMGGGILKTVKITQS